MSETALTLDTPTQRVTIRPIAGDDEVEACAEIMLTSEPWVTLRRTRGQALASLRDREVQEVYVAVYDGLVVGFVIIVVKGAFVGYIRTIAVRAEWRSRGLGRRLIWFAEERIFRDSPNVFMCVSSFNARARALYERLGYEVVGELRDYIVRGYSELVLRKTLGPLAEFHVGGSR